MLALMALVKSQSAHVIGRNEAIPQSDAELTDCFVPTNDRFI